MNLIDRYVQEVARRLPAAQREEVARELRSNLLDELDDRAGGEPPTEDDIAALLREMGTPAAMASSYRPSRRHLIGPDWYPAFGFVLRIVLTGYGALLVGAFVLDIVLDYDRATLGAGLSDRLSGAIDSALMLFAVVVGVFHLLERAGEAPPERDGRAWDPRSLPSVPQHDVIGRGEAIASIVLPAAFLALIFRLRDAIGIRVDDGPLLFNGLVRDLLPWAAAAVLAGMAVQVVLLWRGHWTWRTRIADLAADLLALAICYRFAERFAVEARRLAGDELPERIALSLADHAYWLPASVAAVMIVVHVGVLVRGRRHRRRAAESVAGAAAPTDPRLRAR